MRDVIFRDRTHAGRMLAAHLAVYANARDVMVLGLARGGVVVAAETARLLNLPLDVMVVRKLGTPGQPELAMGAIASGGGQAVNEDVIVALDIHPDVFRAVLQKETQELHGRESAYRAGLPALNVRGLTVIVVDDGLATGATMRAAIRSLRRQHPAHLVVAAPVAGEEAYAEIKKAVDEIVCVSISRSLRGIGAFYKDFNQTTDQEVCDLLKEAKNRFSATGQRRLKAS